MDKFDARGIIKWTMWVLLAAIIDSIVRELAPSWLRGAAFASVLRVGVEMGKRGIW